MRKTTKLQLTAAGLVLSMALTGGLSAAAKEAADKADYKSIYTVNSISHLSAVKEDCMQKVFENLTKADSGYSKLKKDYAEYATFSEKIENNTISITVQTTNADYKELNGTWTYKLDGDYIVNSYKDSEMFGLTLGTYVAQAVSDYLGMDPELVSGYMSAVVNKNIKSDYYSMTIDEAAGTISQKIYVADKYDMSVIDSIYIDSESLSMLDKLTTSSQSVYTAVGKVSTNASGTKDHFEINISEYGDVTDLSYKSILEIVKKAQPIGYEEFLKSYTKLEAASTDYYKVTFPTLEEAKTDNEHVSAKDKFVKVVFKPELTVKAGTAKKLSLKGEKVKKWKSYDKKVVTVSKGKITALKKGSVMVAAVLKDGSELTYNIKVSNSPSLTVGGKKFNKKTTYTVKKNRTLKIKISGKASSVKNVYASSDESVAKVTSKATAKTVKIQGLKQGKATVKIKVNGVNYNIKVNVE